MLKNLKKVISSIAAVAIVASSASAFAVSFPDVDESASYANAVETLTALNVINGDENGKFNPDNSVTRAEFAKMVVEALGMGEAAASSSYTKFADAQGHWAAGYIEAGVSKEFINGYDDITFGPDDTVTYAQAVKMLVAALGYETYAQMQGGWPSGYLSYGSSLKIINGVTNVTNDTALTRAQCAVLIYNAVKAPVCIVDGYTPVYGPNGYTNAPNFEVKDGEGKDWQTLLTNNHDAYVVKGRVVETAKQGTLDNDQVKFRVEVAENFDGNCVAKKYFAKDDDGNAIAPQGTTMNVGETDAADMLFTYAEAIVKVDNDTDEYTILSIVPYGKSETKEFPADQVDVDTSSATRMDVYKSENTLSKYQYKLSTTAEMYVNGSKVDDIDYSYINDNATGTVTLIDSTDVASTSTDGVYDYVMVTKYDSAVVDYIKTTSTKATINVKAGNKLSWDPEDEDIDITFVKDGKEIDYTDLQEYDVLTYAMVPGKTETSFSTLKVTVTTNTVSGQLSGVKTDEVKFDGVSYAVAGSVRTSDFEFNTDYTLYLDAFNNVVFYEEGTTNKLMGIVTGMYTKSGDDAPTVKLVKMDGTTTTFEVKDTDAAEDIYNYVKNDKKVRNANGTTPSGWKTVAEFEIVNNKYISKDDVKDSIQDAVIEYTLSGGKIKFKDGVDFVNDSVDETTGELNNISLEYNASRSKLGSYSIDETTTKILDMDAYLNNTDGEPGLITMANLEDEAKYTSYVYDRNTSGVYNYVIITSGTTSLRPESPIAVVVADNGTTDVDGTQCTMLTVARDGAEDVEIMVEGTPDVEEGSIIMYAVGSLGYVEDDNIKVLMTPAAEYKDLFAAVLRETNFFDAVSNTNTDWVATSDRVELFYGPVYEITSKGLDIFTAKTGNVSNSMSSEQCESLSIAGANTYVYDYSAKADKGIRVSTGTASQRANVYREVYSDTEETTVNWEDDDMFEYNDRNEKIGYDVKPVIAFVRTVDDDVTDIVYFIAE